MFLQDSVGNKEKKQREEDV